MKTQCPWCGTKIKMAEAVTPNNEPAQDGDYSLCAICENFSIYEAGALRKPNDAETLEISTNPEFGKMLAAMQRVKARG